MELISQIGYIFSAQENDDQRVAKMKTIVATIVFSVISLGVANARDGVRDTVLIEPVSSGSSFDYVVHVRNTYDIGYNLTVKEDRYRMALKALRGQCRAARIVGENKIDTEIWGITSSLPDYIVLVKCA
jgi:hypothetical protein